MGYPDDLGPTDGWVYHYTKLQTALEHILPSKKIRLGPLSDTNDPWEGRYDESFSVNVGHRHSTFNASMSALFLGMMNAVVGCFCADVPGLADPDQDQRLARSSCGWARDRMWAQYAEDHRGVCLCFDREKLLESVRVTAGAGECLADNVLYSDEQFEAGPLRPDPKEAKAGGASFVLAFRERLARHRYLTKRLDWKDEREWRIVVLTPPVPPQGRVWAHGDGLVPIDGALRAIVVGHRFSEAYRPVIRDACSRLRIPAFKLQYENGRVALSSRYDLTPGVPPTPAGREWA